jgi:hypothetical protein
MFPFLWNFVHIFLQHYTGLLFNTFAFGEQYSEDDVTPYNKVISLGLDENKKPEAGIFHFATTSRAVHTSTYFSIQ